MRNFLQYALPLYVKEGKSQLTIAVGMYRRQAPFITFARKIREVLHATRLRAGRAAPRCQTLTEQRKYE